MFPSRWEGNSGSGQGRAGKVDTVGKLKVRKQQFAGALFLQRKANKALFSYEATKSEVRMSSKENRNQSVTDLPKEADNEEENLSFFEKIKKSFPSVKRKASDGSNSVSSEDDTRRDSLQSNLSLPAGLDLSRRRPSSASTFGENREQRSSSL